MPVFRFGNPVDAFRDLEREMDRLLRSVAFPVEGVRPARLFPAVNIYESAGEYLLTAEIPGVRVEDLDISVSEGRVAIRGVRKTSDAVPQERFRRNECFHGRWERVVTLPDRVIEDQLHAEMQHGVLVLHLPKAPSTQPRRIPVAVSRPNAADETDPRSLEAQP